MDTLLTTKSASLTELREPGKVLAHAGSTPVAIFNRNAVVAYLVPAEAVNIIPHAKASDADVKAVLLHRRKVIEPTLKYLEDK
ncbi:prevent-host-death family protein [Noviherbaspirillum sedimenti]|uniref:Prevent-host-death family protein n=1 Tax=Noviherbaspirillum sedimenti TaxID=2320865 RepID=A0A3A3G0V4_9BURK|nr:prevent-host-death family protein [Noviherbaspirillum sedimenti]RJG02063.1 prevent-host-death family protein [Noviherbaspirillum sedimenti]